MKTVTRHNSLAYFMRNLEKKGVPPAIIGKLRSFIGAHLEKQVLLTLRESETHFLFTLEGEQSGKIVTASFRKPKQTFK